MEKIKVWDKTFVPFIKNEEIIAAIDKVAAEMNRDFEETDDIPVIICILNGSIIFTSELIQRLNFQCEIACIRIASYTGTKSGDSQVLMGLTLDIKDKNVIVVEDIVDTGKTIIELNDLLKESGAKDIKVATLVLKPDVYHGPVKLDYVALEIPNKFVVGFGMDYNQLGRQYKDIYALEQ